MNQTVILILGDTSLRAVVLLGGVIASPKVTVSPPIIS